MKTNFINRNIFELKVSTIISATNITGNKKVKAIMDLYDSVIVTTITNVPSEPFKFLEDIKEGDYVEGNWCDAVTRETYYTKGIIVKLPSGMFVQEKNDGGITPIEDFINLTKII